MNTSHKQLINLKEQPRQEERVGGLDLLYWIDKYLKDKEDESYNTIMGKKYDLKRWVDYASDHNIHRIEDVKQADLEDFFRDLLKYRAISSVRKIYSTIKNFFGFLSDNDAIDCSKDPMRHLKLSLTENMDNWKKRLITRLEARRATPDVRDDTRILELAKKTMIDDLKRPRYRDYAIFILLYKTGLLPEQITSLKMEQLDVDYSSGRGTLRNISEGRKSNVYDLPLPTEAIESLRLYIEKKRGTKTGFIFITTKGRKLFRTEVWKIVKEISDKMKKPSMIGSETTYNPRKIRRMLLSDLYHQNLKNIELAERIGCHDLKCLQRF
jgi:site-specific recombinase XerD